MFTKSNAGTERPAPLLAALVLVALVPTVGVWWFMTVAMRNERLAVQARLTEAPPSVPSAAFFERLSNPRGVAATIKHAKHDRLASDAGLLTIVKPAPVRQVLERRAQDPGRHSKRFCSSFFASSQFRVSIRPAAKFASVWRSSSACQAGLSNVSPSAARSLQSASMIFSFSLRGSLRSSAMFIPEMLSRQQGPQALIRNGG